MAIMTLERMREFVETNLSDDALRSLMAAAEDDITARLGPTTGVVERHAPGSSSLIYPARRVETVASITETLGLVVVTLATNDYAVWPGGYIIERLVTGTNRRGYWTGYVTLTYTPVGDIDIRARVQVALVKLDLTHNPGLTGQSIGDFSEQYGGTGNYFAEREAILASLGRGVVFA